MSVEDSPAKLRSARTTPARKPCMSNWIRPFFTFSVMMVLTEPRANMQASWIFHLVWKNKHDLSDIKKHRTAQSKPQQGGHVPHARHLDSYVLRGSRNVARHSSKTQTLACSRDDVIVSSHQCSLPLFLACSASWRCLVAAAASAAALSF